MDPMSTSIQANVTVADFEGYIHFKILDNIAYPGPNIAYPGLLWESKFSESLNF